MKICRVVSNFTAIDVTKGDIGPLYYYQSKHMVDIGYEMHIVCGRTEGQKIYENIEGVHIHRVSPITGRRGYLFGDFAKKSFSKIKELDPDIIHGDTSIHFGCVWNRRKLTAPIISQPHSLLDAYKYMDYLPFSFAPHESLTYRMMIRSYFFENKYVLGNSDGIIAVSRASADSIRKYIPDKDIRVIYNGYNPLLFKPTPSDIKEKLDARYLILYAGRPAPWKGIQYLLEATKMLNAEFDGVKVLLLNVVREDMKIYYRWLMDIADKLALKNVIFSKGVPYTDLSKYYSSADCFVLPSLVENCSLSLLEAQGCGCPVVAANAGGNPEIISKESGLLCKPRSSRDLAEKISEVLKHREMFGDRSFVKDFTWERSAKEISDYYTEILSTRRNE
jgi:glycosyltransferase involved in cell wall biosynthesis